MREGLVQLNKAWICQLSKSTTLHIHRDPRYGARLATWGMQDFLYLAILFPHPLRPSIQFPQAILQLSSYSVMSLLDSCRSKGRTHTTQAVQGFTGHILVYLSLRIPSWTLRLWCRLWRQDFFWSSDPLDLSALPVRQAINGVWLLDLSGPIASRHLASTFEVSEGQAAYELEPR